jgi:RNA polymerase sigma-70 factor (ECF subfamily)
LFSNNLLERIAEKSCLQADRLTAQQEALQLCLEQLPKKQRSIVDAAYAPNARIDRLAKSLGRSAMSIYKQLHRTRIALKECVLLHLKSAGWEI